MAYKKPQMVAKSSAKKSYVAGCPSQLSNTNNYVCTYNSRCEVGRHD